MGRRKISTTVYMTPEQDERLKHLSRRTGVPVAEFVRQGIDLILERHSGDLADAPMARGTGNQATVNGSAE